MNSLLFFLVKSAVCMGLFYAVYFFALRRLTFFKWNRWYLNISALCSVVIPMIRIQSDTPLPVDPIVGIWSIVEDMSMPAKMIAPNQASFDIGKMFMIIYWVGLVFMLAKLIYGLTVILLAAVQQTDSQVGKVKIMPSTSRIKNCSFFNMVFIDLSLSNTDNYHLILHHEMKHIALRHSWDKLGIQLLKAVFWFNPFAYLYARSLEEVHEYEVDEQLTTHLPRKTYAELLFSLAHQRPLQLVNQFSHEPLVSRVRMLFMPRSRWVKRTYYGMIIPLLAILIMAFSTQKINRIEASQNDGMGLLKEKNYATIIQPVSSGGKNISPIAQVVSEDLPLTQSIKEPPHKKGVAIGKNAENDVNNRTASVTVPIEASANSFFTRKAIQTESGRSYDEIKMIFGKNRITSGVATGAKVAYMIGNKLYSEDEVKQFDAARISTLDCPCIVKSVGTNDYLREQGDYAAVINIKHQ